MPSATPDRHDGPVPVPSRLSAGVVVDAAVAAVDAGGAAGLTMRGLGPTLGVQAMALYRYFPSRRALLDDVVEAVAESLADTVTNSSRRDSGWHQQLQSTARTMWEMSLDHPHLFVLVATHPVATPGLRPPIRSPRAAEQLLRALEAGGFTPAAARAAYGQFTSFLLGRLLPDATALTAQPRSGPRVPGSGADEADAREAGPRPPVRHLTSGAHDRPKPPAADSSDPNRPDAGDGAYPRVHALVDAAAEYRAWASFRQDVQTLITHVVGSQDI